MYKCPIKVAFLISIVMYCSSCVDTKKATYFNNLEETALVPRREDTISTVIQKNDILNITISSLNAEASAIFNMPISTPNPGNITTAGNSTVGTGYLVNSDGYVQLPILGNIKVADQTTKQVKDAITETLVQKKLLIDPIVTIRHLNYEVTVIGEVTKPTVINVPNEKISLLKALGMAGDITIYGRKENVLLIREVSGKRQVRRIDLNSPEFLTSPYYYLQANDIVYVEANKNKVANASTVRQVLPIFLSGLSIIILALDRLQR
jgi:polysaccharide export outer membrane protein